VDPSFVVMITALAPGPFGVRGSWHMPRCHLPKDEPGWTYRHLWA